MAEGEIWGGGTAPKTKAKSLTRRPCNHRVHSTNISATRSGKNSVVNQREKEREKPQTAEC